MSKVIHLQIGFLKPRKRNQHRFFTCKEFIKYPIYSMFVQVVEIRLYNLDFYRLTILLHSLNL